MPVLDVPFSDVMKFSKGLAQGWLVQYSLQELLWLEHTLINDVEHGQMSV